VVARLTCDYDVCPPRVDPIDAERTSVNSRYDARGVERGCHRRGRRAGAGALALLFGCAGGTLSDQEATFGSGANGGGTVGETDGESATGGSDPSGSGSASHDGQDGDDDPACVGDDCPPDCEDGDPDCVDPTGECEDGECDCPEDGVSSNCNDPTDLGSVVEGEMTLGVVGTVPQENDLDWYTVSFPSDGRPGGGMPAIEFEINEGGAFVFDVVSGQCQAAGIDCGEGGTDGAGIGLDAWSFVDDQPNCCSPPNHALVPWPEQIFLRVYRTTPGESCATYQLRVSR
jgi:hypothetical protein